MAKETEPEYTKCPHFQRGSKFCCGRWHEEKLDVVRNTKATIELRDGSVIYLPAFLLSETENVIQQYWETIKQENPKIIEMYLSGSLSRETEKETYMHYHPGYVTTPIQKYCPFREGKKRSLP